jgi:hypothetical protein
MAKDWTPSHPRYLLTFLPLAIVVLVCLTDRLKAARYFVLAPLAVYSVWLTLWMTDVSPWRREIGARAAMGLHQIDVAYGGDLAPAMRALSRALPPNATVEIFGNQEAWIYAAVVRAPGPRYVLGRGSPTLSDPPLALVEEEGFLDERGFPLPRWVGPPRLWIVEDDLPAFVRANTDLNEMAQETDGDWMMSARALSTLSGAPYFDTRAMNQIRFTVPTFLLEGSPQRFSFKLRARTPIQQIVRRVLCDGAEAPFALADAGEGGTAVAITIARPQPQGRPSNCTLMLNGAHQVSTNPQRGGDLTIAAPGRLELVR